MADKLKKTVEELLTCLKSMALAADNVDVALSYGEHYGRVLKNNPCGVYQDDLIEAKLVARVDKFVEPSAEKPQTGVLHVISMPYAHGGHTRLLERLVQFLPKASAVLVSRPYLPESSALRLPGNITIHSSCFGFSLSELIDIASSYATICFHIEPDDLKAAVAVGVAKLRTGCRVIMVNHADHLFSYGFYCADVVAEVSFFGMAINQKYRMVKSSFLGIPVDVAEYPKVSRQIKDCYQFYSAASAAKFVPSNNFSFPGLAIAILDKIKNSRIVVIGATKVDPWWWPVKLRHPFRFRIISKMSYEAYLNKIRSADVYLDSLPITGGTALPEVRALGIPVAGLVTGAQGYTPFDKTRFLSGHQLLKELQHYVRGENSLIEEYNNSAEIIDEAKLVHSPVEVKQRFSAMLSGEIRSCPTEASQNIDTSFFVAQWQEKGRANVSMDLLRFAFARFRDGERCVLGKVISAIGPLRLPRFLVGYYVRRAMHKPTL